MTPQARTVANAPSRQARRLRPGRVLLHVFLVFMAVTWLVPLLWAAYTALRSYADTQQNGYVSLPASLSLDNFVNAWNGGNFPLFYLNTLIVAVPGVIITLILASMVAFAVSRFRWRFNLFVLILFTAGNLLPQQVLIIPLYQLYLRLPLPAAVSDTGVLYDQLLGILLIHVAFQTGFCVFVLSNYMKTLPHELTEAAQVDGAGVLRIWGAVIMPLCRPAIAALSILEFTFIYNDFFWAMFLVEKGDRRPITSALNNLQGQFFSDTNLLAAGALLAAIPTILVFLALQRQFISGLSLGATKG